MVQTAAGSCHHVHTAVMNSRRQPGTSGNQEHCSSSLLHSPAPTGSFLLLHYISSNPPPSWNSRGLPFRKDTQPFSHNGQVSNSNSTKEPPSTFLKWSPSSWEGNAQLSLTEQAPDFSLTSSSSRNQDMARNNPQVIH